MSQGTDHVVGAVAGLKNVATIIDSRGPVRTEPTEPATAEQEQAAEQARAEEPSPPPEEQPAREPLTPQINPGIPLDLQISAFAQQMLMRSLEVTVDLVRTTHERCVKDVEQITTRSLTTLERSRVRGAEDLRARYKEDGEIIAALNEMFGRVVADKTAERACPRSESPPPRGDSSPRFEGFTIDVAAVLQQVHSLFSAFAAQKREQQASENNGKWGAANNGYH